MSTISSVTLNNVFFIDSILQTTKPKELKNINSKINVIYGKIECHAYITTHDGSLNTNYNIDLKDVLDQWMVYHTNPLTPYNKPIRDYTIIDMLNDYAVNNIGTFIDLGKLEYLNVGYTYVIPNRVINIKEQVTDLLITQKDPNYNISINKVICSVNGVLHNTILDHAARTILIKDGASTIKNHNEGIISAIMYSSIGDTNIVNIDSSSMVVIDSANPTGVFRLDLTTNLNLLGIDLTNKTVILSFMGIMYYLDNKVISIFNKDSIMIDTSAMGLESVVEELSGIIDLNAILPNINNIVSPTDLYGLQTMHNMLDMSQTFLIVIDTPSVKAIKSNISMNVSRNKIKNVKHPLTFLRRYKNSNILADVTIYDKQLVNSQLYSYSINKTYYKNKLHISGYVNPNLIDYRVLTFDEFYTIATSPTV